MERIERKGSLISLSNYFISSIKTNSSVKGLKLLILIGKYLRSEGKEGEIEKLIEGVKGGEMEGEVGIEIGIEELKEAIGRELWEEKKETVKDLFYHSAGRVRKITLEIREKEKFLKWLEQEGWEIKEDIIESELSLKVVKEVKEGEEKEREVRLKVFIPFLLLLLLQRPKREFSYINIETYLSLRKKTSIILYELSRKWIKTGKLRISIRELREKLGLKKYPFAYIKKYYLKPAIDEINKKAEIDVEFIGFEDDREFIILKIREKTKGKEGAKKETKKEAKEEEEEVKEVLSQGKGLNQKEEEVKKQKMEEKLKEAKRVVKEMVKMVKEDYDYITKYEIFNILDKMINEKGLTWEVIKAVWEREGSLEKVYSLLERNDIKSLFAVLKTEIERITGQRIEVDITLHKIVKKLITKKKKELEEQLASTNEKREKLKEKIIELSSMLSKERQKEVLEKVLGANKNFPKGFLIKHALDVEIKFQHLHFLEALKNEIEKALTTQYSTYKH